LKLSHSDTDSRSVVRIAAYVKDKRFTFRLRLKLKVNVTRTAWITITMTIAYKPLKQ